VEFILFPNFLWEKNQRNDPWPLHHWTDAKSPLSISVAGDSYVDFSIITKSACYQSTWHLSLMGSGVREHHTRELNYVGTCGMFSAEFENYVKACETKPDIHNYKRSTWASTALTGKACDKILLAWGSLHTALAAFSAQHKVSMRWHTRLLNGKRSIFVFSKLWLVLSYWYAAAPLDIQRIARLFWEDL